MRLHRLAVTAFGPFADTQTVDFDALAGSGLFLLSGPTGAGKTSVLDAVVFALYGAVPGVRHGAARLRSDHASPDTATEVTLDVTVRGRRLRIVRRPGWERPKLRGTGTTREQPSVRVETVGCDGQVSVLSTRLDEAGQLLRDELGMNLEQFCQVVLLPQGRFAEFLRADADSRRAILQSLFATDRFAAVETELAERRRQAARDVESAQHELARLLSRVSQANGGSGASGRSGATVEPPPEAVSDESACSSWVQELAASALHRADLCIAEQADAGRRCEAARSRHESATVAGERHALAASLAARRDRLAATVAAQHSARNAVDTARRAALLLSPLRLADESSADLRKAQDAERAARRALPAEARLLSAELLAQRTREVRDEIAVLAALRPLADEAEAAAATAASGARAVQRLQRDLEQVCAQLSGLPGQLEAARASRDAARDAAARLPAAQTALDALAGQITHARTRDALEGQLAPAAAALAAAREEATTAHEAWLDLRERRLAAMASELAVDLASGSPCPVCGACEHPAPAAGAATVTAAQENWAQQAYERARDLHRDQLAALGALSERLAAARGAAGSAPLEQLHRANVQALAERGRLAAWASACSDCDGEVSQLQRLLQTATDEERQQRQELAAAVARTSAAETARDDAQRRLGDACGADRTLGARIDRLTALAAAHDEAGSCADRSERSADAHRSVVAACRNACAAAGFADPEAARAAMRAPSQVLELEERIAAHDAESAVVAERLAEFAAAGSEVGDVLGQDRPDVEAAARALHEADVTVHRATGNVVLAKQRSDALANLVGEVESRVAAMRPLREQHQVVSSLATLAEGGGTNSLRMRLSAYVLAARLEQVAEAASERLLRMSSGRYALAHTDATSSARGRAGLGLLVTDAWTGLSRDPATLSGGESFCASLALALGLADVVCAEAGGAVMETLFVDEGFGSLDEEALEDVMDVLDGLREGGRVVGVVSHVGELRSRIPTQLRITKTRSGSRIEPCASATASNRDAA